MVSISIGKGQGLTHGLKTYAESLGYDTSKISQQNWNDTITKLEYIQRDRADENKNSIYSTDTTKSGWQGKMVVQEGNVEFTDGEMESLLTSMGLQTKAKGYENWLVKVAKTPEQNHGTFKINPDGNTDNNVFMKELEKMSTDFISLYDKDKDGKISFNEYKKYEVELTKKEEPDLDKSDLNKAMKTLEYVFNRINVDNEKDSKNKLDLREIMNFFMSMSSLEDKNYVTDGYISQGELIKMQSALTDMKPENSKDKQGNEIKSQGKLIGDFLKRNFNNLFKNYKKD